MRCEVAGGNDEAGNNRRTMAEMDKRRIKKGKKEIDDEGEDNKAANGLCWRN